MADHRLIVHHVFLSEEVLKKQTAQQQAEYNRLSDELAKATGNVSSKRED